MKIVDGPIKGYQAKPRKFLVFVEVGLKGWQKFLRGDQRIVGILTVGSEQTVFDMYKVKESSQVFQGADGQRVS
jgi:hypothetical protein